MIIKPYKTYLSYQEAINDLNTKGTLKYFGSEGKKYVYTLTLWDGRLYRLFIHEGGKVEYYE